MLTCGLLGLSQSGCGLFELGPASKITQTEPVSFRVEVVELGPLNPERVAFPSDMPVAEFLPGDRVRLEIEVVDTEGLALADDRLDSVWLLLGSDQIRIDDPRLELRCDELEEWTVDTPCRLGEGRGSVEYVAPPLGERLTTLMRIQAVIAWDGQSAQECWAARQAREVIPSDCGFLRSLIPLGPPWWLYAYAAEQGLDVRFPVERFPAAVYLQQANRPPKVQSVSLGQGDEQRQLTPINGVVGPVAVVPGEVVSLSVSVDENLQLSQAQFFPLSPEADLFSLVPETIWTRVATAGPIRFDPDFPVPVGDEFQIEIDDDAEPGVARVLLAVYDERRAESLVRVELEIQ
ncbi:MAG: hypothetical protein R6X02_13040 [Enhygromyxa sp.]